MVAPVVTVLMSVHNGERYLREAVDSILGQSLADFEFLIVDDGSTDGTADILASFKDSRIRVLRNSERLGLAASLNRGMALAGGNYIARMDADDRSLPDRLARQVAFMEQHPEIGACGSGFRYFGDDRREVRMPLHSDEIRCTLFFMNAMAHPTVLFRRESFRRHGLAYDVAFSHSQDYDLWVRASRVLPLANLGEALLVYRVHPGQAGQTGPDRQLATARAIWRRQLAELGLAPDADERSAHDEFCLPGSSGQGLNPERIAAWLEKVKAANREKGIFPRPLFDRILDQRWALLKETRRPLSGSNLAPVPLECPSHHERLSVTEGGTRYVCASGCDYPVVRAIPRFVSSTNYAAAFGLQWNRYRTTQLDSFTGSTITRDRLTRLMGGNLDELKGKAVLEVGCGAGRFTEILLASGARLFATDISGAVEANLANCGGHPGYFVCQADLFLPSEIKGGAPRVMYPGECWFEGSCVDHCPVPGAITLNALLLHRVRWEPTRPDPGPHGNVDGQRTAAS